MPDVDLIILYRATTSLALYLQMVFRADRPKEGMFFRCLDYGSNFDRHNAYFYPHPWEKMWKEKLKKTKAGDGVLPMILCPQCESMIFVALRKCKFCGHELPVKEQVLELGESVDVTNKLAPLQGKKASQLSPKELALYANLKNKKALAARIARAKDEEQMGYLKEYGAAMGYKTNWAYLQREILPNTTTFNDFTI
jgi:superfamily II DNA or RNA helicase